MVSSLTSLALFNPSDAPMTTINVLLPFYLTARWHLTSGCPASPGARVSSMWTMAPCLTFSEFGIVVESAVPISSPSGA